MLQLSLNFAHGVHHFIHFLGSSVAHFFVILQHLLLFFVESIKGSVQYFANGHTLLQGTLLVQIAYSGLARPFNLAVVGQDMASNNIQKGGFAFTISAN